MCTLAIAFYPQTKHPLIIGANRDENPVRPSKPWDYRNGVFSPLDIRGDIENGTWIGVNVRGMFCAVTNWDLAEAKGKTALRSRGNVVYDTLLCLYVNEALDFWGTLKAEHYRPFNVILGTKKSLFHLSCDSKEIRIKRLGAGFHWSTGDGFNTKTKRSEYLNKSLSLSACQDLSQPIYPFDIQWILSKHNDGIGSEDSVCVHDETHRWETRSSSLVFIDGNKWNVKYIDQRPCSVDIKEWKEEMVEFDNEFVE